MRVIKFCLLACICEYLNIEGTTRVQTLHQYPVGDMVAARLRRNHGYCDLKSISRHNSSWQIDGAITGVHRFAGFVLHVNSIRRPVRLTCVL